VAVPLSQAGYQRLAQPRGSFPEFVHEWRAAMPEQDIAFADEHDFEGLRELGERATHDFA